MKIEAYLPKGYAITARSEKFGKMEIDVDLSVFSDAELAQLQSMSDKAINVTAPTAQAVQAECARLIQVDLESKAELEAQRKELSEKIARNAERAKENSERIKEAMREKEEKEAAAQAEKIAWETDKTAWIEAHGSDRLKKAHAAGYPHNSAYARERANMEFGEGWIVDTKDSYEWDQKVFPSEAALDMERSLKAKGYEAEIVWIKSEGKERDYEDEAFEPFETVVVRKFLGKYDVINAAS